MVRQISFNALEVAYEDLRLRTGRSEITAANARRSGYAPWAAWPQWSIDRREAVPDWSFVEDSQWREAIRERYTTP